MSSSSLAWQEVATTQEQRPTLPRSGHCAARLPPSHSSDVIIFGGYTEDDQKKREACNDAWTFSLESKSWTTVQYSGDLIPRVRLASQCVVVDNKLWVIGGWDPGHKQDGGDILSDVWTLDLNTYAWTEIKLQGESLEAISRFQAVAVGQKIFIHTHRSLQDILILDTATSPPTLTKQPVTGSNTPSSRGLHSLTAIGNKLWLYGGAPKSGSMLGDLWALDLSTLEWREIRDGEKPHVRCSQAAAAVGDELVMFGGAYYRDDGPGLAPLGDLWTFDTNDSERGWKELQTAAQPTPRNAGIMVAVDGVLVLQGGWLAFQETYDDTWILDYDST
ncbi:hypothetical protein WJX73_007394 [Symbiochloris irregularis]|uniref:Galactose oxidase n=1 Tax=Symbiochloris irregularis TaxID=706552 RepID=A0AAW1NUT1_9CHLO